MSAGALPIDGMLEVIKSAAPSREASLRRMQAVANILDNAFVIPGTKQRIGIDAIIGLMPGVGDVLTTILSSYVIWEARNLGVSRVALVRMYLLSPESGVLANAICCPLDCARKR